MDLYCSIYFNDNLLEIVFGDSDEGNSNSEIDNSFKINPTNNIDYNTANNMT